MYTFSPCLRRRFVVVVSFQAFGSGVFGSGWRWGVFVGGVGILLCVHIMTLFADYSHSVAVVAHCK